MSRCEKVIEKAINNPDGLKFAEAQRLAECLGFELRRVRGSHHVYKHPESGTLANLQSDQKMAKGYQVRQLLERV